MSCLRLVASAFLTASCVYFFGRAGGLSILCGQPPQVWDLRSLYRQQGLFKPIELISSNHAARNIPCFTFHGADKVTSHRRNAGGLVPVRVETPPEAYEWGPLVIGKDGGNGSCWWIAGRRSRASPADEPAPVGGDLSDPRAAMGPARQAIQSFNSWLMLLTKSLALLFTIQTLTVMLPRRRRRVGSLVPTSSAARDHNQVTEQKNQAGKKKRRIPSSSFVTIAFRYSLPAVGSRACL
nr:unnamed protein product [Digitaria exilis]